MPNFARQLETVDDRHTDVHQCDVRHQCMGFGQGVGGAVRDTNFVSKQGQQLAERIGHITNVIDHQDVRHRSQPKV
jgi:hypothetical protein